MFGFGVALAGLAGVLAAPMRAVNPLMGADLIIMLFAVVVIGGLGSILGVGRRRLRSSASSQASGRRYVPDRSSQTLDLRPHGRRAALVGPAGLFGREEAPA